MPRSTSQSPTGLLTWSPHAREPCTWSRVRPKPLRRGSRRCSKSASPRSTHHAKIRPPIVRPARDQHRERILTMAGPCIMNVGFLGTATITRGHAATAIKRSAAASTGGLGGREALAIDRTARALLRVARHATVPLAHLSSSRALGMVAAWGRWVHLTPRRRVGHGHTA